MMTPTQHHTRQPTLSNIIYLVKEIDNLGENVEASPWVDGSLIEDASLLTTRHSVQCIEHFFLWSTFFV